MAQEQVRKGCIAIVKETVRMIGANRKMFIQVTAALLLLVWCLFFAVFWFLFFLYKEVTIVREWILSWAVITALGTSSMLLTLLSSCSLVFTFGYVYSYSPNCKLEMTFRKVIAASPRICRDLLYSFVYLFLGFAILSVAIGLIFIWKRTELVLAVTIPSISLQTLGIYMFSMIWQLASAVTILEGVRGNAAVKRSLVPFSLVLTQLYCLAYACFMIMSMLEAIWRGGYSSITERIAMVGFWQLLFFILICLFLVMSLCFYFVCKEYNLETVDKTLLAALLGGYLEQGHLSGDEVQIMEEMQVSPAV